MAARPPAIVKAARQALAIDERRKVFAPEVWKGTSAPGQSLAQRWFAGVHTNVGGGYEHDGLANTALHWMADEARAAGLDLNAPFLNVYRPWHGDDWQAPFVECSTENRLIPPRPAWCVIRFAAAASATKACLFPLYLNISGLMSMPL